MIKYNVDWVNFFLFCFPLLRNRCSSAMVIWLPFHSNDWCLWTSYWVIVTEFERARHISCTSPQLSRSSCHHRDRKLEHFLTIILERKCLFLTETWHLWNRVYEEVLSVCYVVRNLGQNMEQPYELRCSAILKKEKPTLISIELDLIGQLWPEYNLDTLEVTCLHFSWTASLWSMVE